MAHLQVHLLGRFTLHAHDQPLDPPPTRKAESLLAYLLVYRDRPQQRDWLAGLFWGDRPEERARRSLSTALWHIRQNLPEDVELLHDSQTVHSIPRLKSSLILKRSKRT